MKKLTLFAALCAVCTLVRAGQVLGPVEFMDDVSVGSWGAISNLSYSMTSGGSYTNGTYTNYYRLCGTNLKGRLPASSNLVVTFIGATNSNNAVVVSWPRYDGISTYVVDRSYDSGATWTNWYALGASYTNWTDDGSETNWSTNIFTNAYTLIPGPSVPWVTNALTATNSPADGQVIKYDAASGDHYYSDDLGGSGTGNMHTAIYDTDTNGVVDQVDNESDPNWASVSNTVTTRAANGDTAHGWGNHATNSYLTTESDPNAILANGGRAYTGSQDFGLKNFYRLRHGFLGADAATNTIGSALDHFYDTGNDSALFVFDDQGDNGVIMGGTDNGAASLVYLYRQGATTNIFEWDYFPSVYGNVLGLFHYDGSSWDADPIVYFDPTGLVMSVGGFMASNNIPAASSNAYVATTAWVQDEEAASGWGSPSALTSPVTIAGSAGTNCVMRHVLISGTNYIAYSMTGASVTNLYPVLIGGQTP